MEIKKYLPSKKFSKTILIFVILIFIIIIILYLFTGKNKFISEKKEKKLAVQKMTLNQLVALDTDGDGIPDWEEKLWGTDPNKKMTFEGILDSDYIANKKKLLGIENNLDTENLTETDKLARQFFSTYMAIKSSDVISDDVLYNFTEALGEKIITPNVVDIYNSQVIKINNNKTKDIYYNEISSFFEEAKKAGIGDELLLVAHNLTANPSQDQVETNLIKVSEAYKNFAQQVINLSVPNSLSAYHLKIANNAHNTGVAVANMSKTITDPVIGLSGLAQYQKYSEELIFVAESLAKAL